MLCTRCGETAAPDSRVAGSDRLELALWLVFLVPGLLYCVWRHLQRRRTCPACGSSDLIRESRASRSRDLQNDALPAPGAARGRLVYAAPRISWMASPGVRLRRMTRGGALAGAGVVAFAFVSMNTVNVKPDERALIAAVQPQDEAEMEKQRARRVEDRRHRECERLCTEFHRSQAHGHRKCMDNCQAKLFDESGDEVARSACADLLDPTACDFVAGTGKPRPNPTADAADPMAEGSLTDLTRGR
jgi:hypothetical protein